MRRIKAAQAEARRKEVRKAHLCVAIFAHFAPWRETAFVRSWILVPPPYLGIRGVRHHQTIRRVQQPCARNPELLFFRRVLSHQARL